MVKLRKLIRNLILEGRITHLPDEDKSPEIYKKLAVLLTSRNIEDVRQALELAEPLQYIEDLKTTVKKSQEWEAMQGGRYTYPEYSYCFNVSPYFYDLLQNEYYYGERGPTSYSNFSPEPSMGFFDIEKRGMNQICIVVKDEDDKTFL